MKSIIEMIVIKDLPIVTVPSPQKSSKIAKSSPPSSLLVYLSKSLGTSSF